MTKPRDDFDNAWKEILEGYFEAFIAFFFPQAHAEIDWDRGVEFLDKELQYAVGVAGKGSRAADKLAKVWLKTGEEAWLLVHVEVQSQSEEQFDERMYMYNSLLFCRHRRCVVSFGILGDTRRNWRPNQFEYGRWGSQLTFRFPVVKLLDYEERWEELERSENPFAAVVMAHLKTQATGRDPETRLQWKTRILRWLFEQGKTKEEVADLFRFIDLVMRLPSDLDQACFEEVRHFEEERNMALLSPFEERAMARAHKQTVRENVVEVLSLRFGEAPSLLVQELEQIDDPAALKNLHRKAVTADSLDEFEQELAETCAVR